MLGGQLEFPAETKDNCRLTPPATSPADLRSHLQGYDGERVSAGSAEVMGSARSAGDGHGFGKKTA